MRRLRSCWRSCSTSSVAERRSRPPTGPFPPSSPWVSASFLAEFLVISVVLGILIAVVAWLAARVNARGRLLKALRATALDPHDTYHHQLANVVDELRIAAGEQVLDAVVLRALTVNAVSFASPGEPPCVGVTEGALSRLSRPQLQTVVAHEVAHVASRDCLVATRACLLFLGVQRIAEIYGRPVGVSMIVGYVGICLAALMPLAPIQIGMFWVSVAVLVWTAVWLSFWLAASGGSAVELALSRQREFAADAAAVRYTGDPASLAEALLVIEWQKGAAPAVPRSLASLAIAPAGGRAERWPWRWFDPHPPLAVRIGRIQALAAERGQSLWERRADVERRVRAREHVVTAGSAVAAVAASPAGSPVATAAPLAGATGPVTASQAARCPRCTAELHELIYEGSVIVQCPSCGGVGATGPQVEAILARRDWGFTPEQTRLADMIERHQGARRTDAAGGGGRPRPLSLPWPAADADACECPLCRARMRRSPWSLAYPLPRDHCAACDLNWFDRDEIEVLQALVEHQTG